MDYLRWILLVAGIFFVLIIYFVGRKSRQQDTIYDNRMDDDTPEFTANDWQDSDEGVGDVRIVAREKDDYEDEEESSLSDDTLSDATESRAESVDTADQPDDNQGDNESVIVLHILARSPDRLAGDKINSAAQANGLKFGDMNIFHCVDNGHSVFSMANMMEPGIFDPDTMHELETPGLTLFMQKSTSNNIDIFEGMLSCAYRMSEMLGAQLCNRQRQPLTQSDAEQYRELATSFDG
jgi:cell division protein ZipA